MEKVASRIVDWIREQVNDATAEGVVLGLSGGIDSSVTAALCKRAFHDNTLGLIMPCLSDPIDVEHANLLAERFEIETRIVDLGRTFEAMLKELGAMDEGIPAANLKSRLRMSALYYFANKLNYLVVGAGNRTEWIIGYFAKYGDGGVDILPIGDLLKRDVIGLANHLGIPDEIIEKTPSAGLWKGQTDEGEIGIRYEELDGILSGIWDDKIDDPNSHPEIDKVKKMIKESEHKRKSIPVCKIKYSCMIK